MWGLSDREGERSACLSGWDDLGGRPCPDLRRRRRASWCKWKRGDFQIGVTSEAWVGNRTNLSRETRRRMRTSPGLFFRDSCDKNIGVVEKDLGKRVTFVGLFTLNRVTGSDGMWRLPNRVRRGRIPEDLHGASRPLTAARRLALPTFFTFSPPRRGISSRRNSALASDEAQCGRSAGVVARSTCGVKSGTPDSLRSDFRVSTTLRPGNAPRSRSFPAGHSSRDGMGKDLQLCRLMTHARIPGSRYGGFPVCG